MKKKILINILQIKSKQPSNFLRCISEVHKKERIFTTHSLLNYSYNAAELIWLPFIKKVTEQEVRELLIFMSMLKCMRTRAFFSILLFAQTT